ncbi:putative MFS transporter [Rhodotorula diobovata]|uniref:Putative MFS transporter n=1 Tax=Rhodotorula diobovata TaxID=5288 RepID=A0A5C5FRZ1_9BASI|nr:putative MFS transporter [Rhodotorula diobovata]
MDRTFSSDIEKTSEKASIHDLELAAQPGVVLAASGARHVAVIDEAAEARLRRKFDVRLLPVVAAIYLFCFIDRANIGNAKIAGLEKDLGMSGLDYNVLLCVFYISYTVFELPLQLVTKKFGPGKTLPIFTLLFGLFSLVMGFVKNYGQAIGVRFLLGIAEGAIFPGLAFYLSRFYRKDELGFRLSCYLVCTPAAGAFGGLLASGLLKIDSIGPYRSWRCIFIVEGLITMAIGLIAWFLMPDRPEACKWLTDEERALAEVRIKSENVGQSQAIDTLRKKAVLQGIFAPSTLVVAVIFMFNNITVQGVGFLYVLSPTIVKTIYPNETTINLQLRTVPPYVVGAFVVLLTGYLSFKTRKRALYMVVCAPFVTIGYSLYISSMDPQVRYAAAFMVATGSFAFGALTTAWAAANVTSDSARAAAIGTVIMFGNCGGLISTWTFLPKDGPRYLPGNSFNLAGSVVMLVLTAGLWTWQVRENRAKENGRDDHYLVSKTEEEIQLLGTKNPHFRYSV